MSVHCLESGCIGKYTPLGPRDFPCARNFAPPGPRDCPRAISRASGCKIPALGKSLGPRGVYFPIHPSSRQCTDTLNTRTSFTFIFFGWDFWHIKYWVTRLKTQGLVVGWEGGFHFRERDFHALEGSEWILLGIFCKYQCQVVLSFYSWQNIRRLVWQ